MQQSKKRRVTLKDVAGAVGVHISTVSRALDPKTRHLITEEVAEKIVRTASELGYRPDSIAYSLRTRRSLTVGVLVPDITNVIFPPILRGIEDGLAERGYIAIMVNTDSDPQRETTLIETLRARGVDGLILASVQLQDPAISRAVADGIPAVTVNRKVNDPAVSSVVHDDDTGMRLAVAHMVELGHRRIAHIAGPQDLSTGLLRYRAFIKAAKEHGLDLDKDLIVFSRGFNESEGERSLRELANRGKLFSAIVCANDRLAIGAVEGLRSLGFDCPDQVSVSGYNDMALVDRIQPPLTTIRIRQYESGLAAARVLLEQFEQRPDDRRPRHIVLPVELIVRGSTAPLGRLRVRRAAGRAAPGRNPPETEAPG